jgi:UDP:flavonoid glycosyltransferase YjiC (YdhE family)
MRVLIAWEFGDNYGHAVACLSVALELRARGHEVLFAVCNTQTAEEVIGPHDFRYLQAPRAPSIRGTREAPQNYSGLFTSIGLANVPTLKGVVRSWLSLFELAKPDVVVLDHAPIALLATRIAQSKAITVSNGFFLPPDVDPLPNIRPWERHDRAQLRQLDQQLVAAFNQVLTTMNAPSITSLPQLFQSVPAILRTFPELDHYGPRENVTYVGPLEMPADGKVVDWPSAATRKILVYMRPSVVGSRELLGALSRESANTICAVPGFSNQECQQYSGPGLRLHNELIQIKPLLESASLVVTYSGAGLLTQSLLAGVPLLMVPNTSEQYLGTKRVEALSAGIVIGKDRSPAVFSSALARLNESPEFSSAASAFAQAHADFDSETARRKVADAIVVAAQ